MSQTPALPPEEVLMARFSDDDTARFANPDKVFYPETWFHFIGGNVSKEGITADLEAIAQAKISGIQLFHGQAGGAWPEVKEQITCLSPKWDDAVKYVAQECKRLGLRFTMQNCPGWAMSGGPWIEPSQAMRTLVWSRTDVSSDGAVTLPKPQPSEEEWRDYQDIAVLAFPTPAGDSGKPLVPESVTGTGDYDWKGCLSGMIDKGLALKPSTNVIDVKFPSETIVRTIQFPSVRGMNHNWCYEPGVHLKMEAIMKDGKEVIVADLDFPQSDWQDFSTFTIACNESEATDHYRITLKNAHDITLDWIKFYSSGMKNDWEAAAGWTLRSIERTGEHVRQDSSAYIDGSKIIDISGNMNPDGALTWKAPDKREWTILRIGHVNAGRRNAPAPPEGTGWECDKLSTKGPDAHFAGYIGRLAKGPLNGGLLGGMLMDSWECRTQTWTSDMEDEFGSKNGYQLRKWLPALMGYVIDDPETTTDFLLDWKRTINHLFTDEFYGRMSELAHENGLSVQYETAAGDIFPADIMEYYKYADIPMCEFWQPMTEDFVGSLNFKPIKPTASAAHIYGKPRVAAESFTSFNLTWDEHWEMLKEVANVNYIEGVTHSIFHTYTHNPQIDFLKPGTTFGSNIGTPFLRGQTWWRLMPEFTTYLARCSYMLERGLPANDVLWYLGDEINHKPDQEYPFPEGYKYDYCNSDVLLNRLSVKHHCIVTPEGVSYKVMWLHGNERMLPETIEKIDKLVRQGATVIGDAPVAVASLRDEESRRFEDAKEHLWGNRAKGINKVGKGKLVVGMNIDEALKELGMIPDFKGDALWLHRKVDGADWYYVAAPSGSGFDGDLSFKNIGSVQIWDPLTGAVTEVPASAEGDYSTIHLSLPRAGCCFVVFRHDVKTQPSMNMSTNMSAVAEPDSWTVRFPKGWGAPESLSVKDLKPWKDLELGKEGRAFSGTAVYETEISLGKEAGARYSLDLGSVEMIAEVYINGNKVRTLWTEPYSVDVTDFLVDGTNSVRVDVTSTWFNRLAYDANLPEAQRKTWTIAGPAAGSQLRESGLLGPVTLYVSKN